MIILQVEKRSPKRPWRVCLRGGEEKVFIKMLFFQKGNIQPEVFLTQFAPEGGGGTHLLPPLTYFRNSVQIHVLASAQ